MAIRALIAVEARPEAIRDPSPNNIDLLESCLSVRKKFESAWSLGKSCKGLPRIHRVRAHAGIACSLKTRWLSLSAPPAPT